MAAKTRLIEVEKEIGNILTNMKRGLVAPSVQAELLRLEAERDQPVNAPKVTESLEVIAEELVPMAERYRQNWRG